MTIPDRRKGVKPSPCPNCGKPINSATETGGGNIRPSPGDITICFYCHHLMAFADDMTMRDLTDAEIRDCAGDPELLIAMRALASFKDEERRKERLK